MIGARDFDDEWELVEDVDYWNKVVASRVDPHYAACPPLPVLVRVALIATWGDPVFVPIVVDVSDARILLGAAKRSR